MTSPGAMRAHLHFTAFLFVLIGAVFALAAVLAPSLFSATAQAMAESGEEGADVGAALMAWTGRTVAIGGAVLSLPSLVCGWGLAVVQVPVGTIVGGYILWVLLSARFESWFEPAKRDGVL
jgi:hypothetical protein